MKTKSRFLHKTRSVILQQQVFLATILSTLFLHINFQGISQSTNDFKCDAAVISSPPEDTTGVDLLSQQIGEPCNSGCATGDFEYPGFSVDFGFTKRYGCGIGPFNNLMIPNQHIFPCMRTTNRSGDKYWWWVDHTAALNSQNPGCSYPSSVACQVLLASPEIATVDYITSTTLMGLDTMFCFLWDGNPDDTWDPLNEDNNHYARFATSSGIKWMSDTPNCPQGLYRNYNEYSEGLKVAANANNDWNDHPNLVQGQQYVLEFYTSNSGFLEDSWGNDLAEPTQDNFSLRYFVGPSASANCTTPYIEYITAQNGCQYNSGRFQAGLNCSPTWNYNYSENESEEWVHLTQTFTAASSEQYAVYFSPITQTYFSGQQIQTGFYFADDVWITPVSANPISAELSIQGDYGPVVTWNGFYQFPLNVFVETDWAGSNSAPVTVVLDLPAGITIASGIGWVNNTYTFPTGTLNQNGINLPLMLNVGNGAQGTINEISLTASSGCLNHVPIIGVEFFCDAPDIAFTDFLYCPGNPSILAYPTNSSLGTLSGPGNWDGPGTYTATGMTAANVVSGNYVFTLGDSVCSQNYSHSITLLDPLSYTILGATTVDNQTTWDLSSDTVVYMGDVKVNATYTWDVNNSLVLFANDKRVQVLADGNVVSYNSTFDAACPVLWRGFEIQGNPTQAETTNLGTTPHGTCQLSKCNVNNAYIGIYAQGYLGTGFDSNKPSGMVVLKNNCKFTNNRQDLNFQRPSAASNFVRRSQIGDTEFILNSAYWSSQVPVSRIFHTRNSGVKYAGISVINQDPIRVISIENFTGVQLDNSKVHILCNMNDSLATSVNCTKTNIIEGFVYGIRAIRSLSSGIPTMRVHNTEFRCHRGYYSQGGVGTVSFTLDDVFKNLPSNFTTTPNCNSSQPYIGPGVITYQGRYGAYFQGLHPTNVIESNDFIGTYNLDSLTHVGLVINGNGGITNTVYNNNFTTLRYGISFYGVNRNTVFIDQGMKFACNSYTNNVNDNIITNSNNSAAPAPTSGLGIAKFQGSSTESAGNKFTSYTPIANDDIDEKYNSCFDHQYFYRNTGSTENFNTLESNVDEFVAQQANPCLPDEANLLTPGANKMLYEALLEEYNSLKDAGSTAEVKQEIQVSTYENALTLYYSLMEKSPNLSEEVLLEAVMKEYDLPSTLLTLILQNNPQAAKSSEIIEGIDNRMIPLEEWQISIIEQGKTWHSDIENLRIEISDIIKNYNRSIAQELSIIESQNITENDKENLIINLLTDDWQPAKLQLGIQQISMGRISEGVITLESLVAELPEGDLQRNDLLSFIDVIGSTQSENAELANYVSENLNWLTSILADDNLPFSSSIAYGLLQQSGYAIFEPLYNDSETKNIAENHGSNASYHSEPKNTWFSLSPNPAVDYVIIRLENAPISSKAIIEIADTNGKLVGSYPLQSNNGMLTIDISSLAGGVYALSIVDFGYNLTTQKLLIQN